MSLSPLVSFKSRFVTYLLNFPRTMTYQLHVSAVSQLAIIRLEYNVRGTIYLLKV